MNQNPIIKALQEELAKERNEGHEAATARLLALLEKAVEMAEYYGNKEDWCGINEENGFVWLNEFCPDNQDYENTDGTCMIAGKKAREFLTTLADASGEIFKDEK